MNKTISKMKQYDEGTEPTMTGCIGTPGSGTVMKSQDVVNETKEPTMSKSKSKHARTSPNEKHLKVSENGDVVLRQWLADLICPLSDMFKVGLHLKDPTGQEVDWLVVRREAVPVSGRALVGEYEMLALQLCGYLD